MNSLNGIIIEDECVEHFTSLNKSELRYVVYKIDVNQKPLSVTVEREGVMSETTHDDVSVGLPADDCRFVFFNVSYHQGVGERLKMVMALWCPAEAPVKAKMVYAAASGPLKSKLGTHAMGPLQASHSSAFDYGEVVGRCRKSYH
jgi:hypothetical protein